jgi:hypothetical protein
VTHLHQIGFKGNILSATPGHGNLQHPDVLANRLEIQRFGLETEVRASKNESNDEPLRAIQNSAERGFECDFEFPSQSRQNATMESPMTFSIIQIVGLIPMTVLSFKS